MHGLFHERWQSKDEHFWVASGFGGSCLVVWVPAMDGDGLWGWSISLSECWASRWANHSFDSLTYSHMCAAKGFKVFDIASGA